jgi:hypothetical protein
MRIRKLSSFLDSIALFVTYGCFPTEYSNRQCDASTSNSSSLPGQLGVDGPQTAIPSYCGGRRCTWLPHNNGLSLCYVPHVIDVVFSV